IGSVARGRQRRADGGHRLAARRYPPGPLYRTREGGGLSEAPPPQPARGPWERGVFLPAGDGASGRELRAALVAVLITNEVLSQPSYADGLASILGKGDLIFLFPQACLSISPRGSRCG